MSSENSKSMICPCTYSCDNHGECHVCVAAHTNNEEFPACFFSSEAEKKHDRSFTALMSDRKAKQPVVHL